MYEVLPDGRFKLKGGKQQPGNGAKKPASSGWAVGRRQMLLATS